MAKLNTAGNALIYSTLLGGNGTDAATAIAVDSLGKAWVAGFTTSTDFPLLNASQTAYAGSFDAFAAELNSSGAGLIFSTYLGGAGDDRAAAVALDVSNGVIVAGYTASIDFPTSTAAFQPLAPGGYNGYLVRFFPRQQPPSVVSVSPSSGSGSSQVFTVTVADPDGASDVNYVLFLMNQIISGAGACYVLYNPSMGLLWLENDAGTAWLTPVAAGSGTTVSNSQCTLNAAGSSYTAVGVNLTANISLSFSSGLQGTNDLFVWAADRSGLYSGWQTMGSWFPGTVDRPPSVVSMSPSSGSGSSQVFTVTVADPDGASDVNYVLFLMNQVISGAGACYVLYNPSMGLLWLENDAGTAWLTPIVAGSGATVSNSQCTLNAAGSSYTAVGVNLTANISLSFSSGLQGTNNLFVWAADRSGLYSGWQTMGSWFPGTVDRPPSVVSMSPSSGSGNSQVFTVTVADPDGASDVNYVLFLMNQVISGAGACYVLYNPSMGLLWLENDAGTAWLTPIAAGSGATLSNSQCTLNAAGSSYTAVGVNLTANISLSFHSGFQGTKNLYVWAADRSGLYSGWQTMGIWVAGTVYLSP